MSDTLARVRTRVSADPSIDAPPARPLRTAPARTAPRPEAPDLRESRARVDAERSIATPGSRRPTLVEPTPARRSRPPIPAVADVADPAAVHRELVGLRRDSDGAAVSTLQRALNAYFGREEIDVDGDFGTQTEAAVRKFQRAEGLDVDGIVGRDTLRALGPHLPAPSAPTAPAAGQPAPSSPPAASAPGGADWSRSLSSFNATRVDAELPARGPDHTTYKPYRFGTARTVELVRRVAETFHRETGQQLRVGDIAARGGGRIPDHRSHTSGNIFDLDMAFTDGRTTVEPNRSGVNATWRSPAYDRESTRTLVRIIKRYAPRAQILFNDPVLAREGLVVQFPNHDNHLHVQRLW